MTCKHRSGDPNCSSSPEGMERRLRETSQSYQNEVESLKTEIVKLKREIAQLKSLPDNSKYEIVDSSLQGNFLILKVSFESCEKCAFEGTKVLVYKGVEYKDVIKWKVIDPHFVSDTPLNPTRAPSPFARFPNTEEGWNGALSLCSYLSQEKKSSDQV